MIGRVWMSEGSIRWIWMVIGLEIVWRSIMWDNGFLENLQFVGQLLIPVWCRWLAYLPFTQDTWVRVSVREDIVNDWHVMFGCGNVVLQHQQYVYTRDSSVGRAVDCRKIVLISIGHRFDSGSREFWFTWMAFFNFCKLQHSPWYNIISTWNHPSLRWTKTHHMRCLFVWSRLAIPTLIFSKFPSSCKLLF